jgi:hypothetical protein
VCVLMLLAAPGRPLFYWGARPALIETGPLPSPGVEAQVVEVHAAIDRDDLVLRVTFDRPVSHAIRLPDGTPVSGRLRAVLHLDADGERATGWDAGSGDLRTGAELRVEVGVLALGADAQEKRPAQAIVMGSLFSLGRDGRRRSVWRSDDAAADRVSVRGDGIELRIPATGAREGSRLILTAGDRVLDGRLRP